VIKVSEIFSSIQGESTYAGLPCSFVRLSGCNLRCGYCDTTYAYDDGVEMDVASIVARVSGMGIDLVEVTGGEPLMQDDAPALITGLLDAGFKVLVETNGTMDIGVIDERAVVVLDVKTPGSGEGDSFMLGNLEHLKPSDEVKFVLAHRADYEWARGFISEHALEEKAHILLSPYFGRIEPAGLVQWMLDDGVRARLNMQLHKYIFDPDERGC